MLYNVDIFYAGKLLTVVQVESRDAETAKIQVIRTINLTASKNYTGEAPKSTDQSAGLPKSRKPEPLK